MTDNPTAAPPPTSPMALMDREEYRQQRASNVLRTPESMKWFIRTNYDELVKAGALLTPAGRQMVHADRFDAAILQIGQRRAQT